MKKYKWYHRVLGIVISVGLISWILYLTILGIKKLIGLF